MSLIISDDHIHNNRNDNEVNNNPGRSLSLQTLTTKTKRRRTLNKLNADRENLPLRELLFYNPPETVFQKENRELHEEQQNEISITSPMPASVTVKRRSSSRSSSISSESNINNNKDDDLINNNNNDDNNSNNDNNQQSNSIDTSIEKEEITSSNNSVQSAKVNIPANMDGMLTIDEKGNIVVAKSSDTQNDSNEDDKNKQQSKLKSSTTYNSFRRHERPRNFWTPEETSSFFTALEIVGTDFSLMKAVFFKESDRDRKQLKQKFKREEKINRDFVDKILYKSLRNRSKIKSIIDSQNDNNNNKNNDDNNNNELADKEIKSPVKELTEEHQITASDDNNQTADIVEVTVTEIN